MNKQELIGTLRKLLTKPSEGTDFDYGHDYGIQRAIYLAEDLDDPVIPPELEKPKVPQFVADWYEEHKDNFEIYLSGLCINFTCHRERLNDKLANWYEQLENKPIQTLVNMHQLGYEVQKEKLYTVEIPNPRSSVHYVLRKGTDGQVCISCYVAHNWRYHNSVQLTEEEIKKDFDWAWDFAEGVEELNE